MIKYINKYENKESYYIIHCFNKDNVFLGDILFDSSDYSIIKEYKWHIEKSHSDISYAACTQKGKTLRMHRLLMPNAIQIDHINHNGLDNRRQNLRACTNRENNLNKKGNLDRGIRILPNGRFYVRIMVHKKELNLGTYDTIEEARKAREGAEKKYFGEFRYNYKEGVK